MTTTTQNQQLPTIPEEGRVPAEKATPKWLSEGDGGGASVRAIRERKRKDPGWQTDLLEANRLYEKVLSGNSYAALQFVEAMSTSDFPLLFADVLDREMLGAYQDWPATWPAVARRGSTRDFRTVKRFFLDGGAATLEVVGQREEYPEAKLDEGKYEYSVSKRGRVLDLPWETLINDDLDAFRELPMTLGRAAKLSEDKFVTDLFAGATGPDTTFFAAGNNNIITANPTLTVAGLQTGFKVLAAQKDTDGNPIFYPQVALVVPPALEITAQNILNATEIRVAAGSGSATTDQLVAVNWMRNRTRLVVDPWLPIISTTNGDTSWYLIGVPSIGRPAMEVGFLRGRETPDLFVKAPNALRVGGGMAPVEDGDFETDSIRHKVRHVVGGTLMDPKAAAASNGTGA